MFSKRHELERAEKIAFWEPHITAWRNSELGATAYCRQHSLSLHKFKYWQYQIAKSNTDHQATTETANTNQNNFIEVVESNTLSPAVGASSSCQIVTQYGFTISFQGELSSQHLQTVILALKALS